MRLQTYIHAIFFILISTYLAACTGAATGTATGGIASQASLGSGGNNNATPVVIGTGEATINWTVPTENTDNSSLNDLAGYKIYYGYTPDALIYTIYINDNTIDSYPVYNLQNNTRYYFAITAVNSTNNESAKSQVIYKDITG